MKIFVLVTMDPGQLNGSGPYTCRGGVDGVSIHGVAIRVCLLTAIQLGSSVVRFGHVEAVIPDGRDRVFRLMYSSHGPFLHIVTFGPEHRARLACSSARIKIT